MKIIKFVFLLLLLSWIWFRVLVDMELICLCMLLCNGLWNVCMVDIFIDFVIIRMLIGVCDMECYVVMGWD